MVTLLALILAAKTFHLEQGMVLKDSIFGAHKTYNFTAKDEITTPVLTIKDASDAHLDFNFDTLQGTSQDTPPDKRKGLALLIEGGHNITVRNLRIHGYKLAILARNVDGLHLLNCDWSYNWKQHLKSTREKEDESDWMSFHHNEHDEWVYGSKEEPAYGCGGAYMVNCKNVTVEHCRNTGSQCGLMLSRCDNGRIEANDFSFLSGIGLGLYRTSHFQVALNKLDWCVRGFSYGVYNRGQDSAGILVYEQSSNNTFLCNSVTHGGDGFFLWAGQTTMDSGEGGCNDNLVAWNDFSHSPCNGIEATFSRNEFRDNLAEECWHAIWGGYSYATRIVGNTFKLDGEGIAIEHGQDNTIAKNYFDRSSVGIELWSDLRPPDPVWGYPKHRDVRSRDYRIEQNVLSNHATAFDVRLTEDCSIYQNEVLRFGKLFAHESLPYFSQNTVCTDKRLDGQVASANTVELNPACKPLPPILSPSGRPIQPLANSIAEYLKQFRDVWYTDASKLTGPLATALEVAPAPVPFLTKDQLRGQRYILVDEWGPYDFRSPRLWLRQSNGTSRTFEILGPAGKWRLKSMQGADSVSARAGQVPGMITVHGANPNLHLALEFVGGQATTPFGKRIAAGTPVQFSSP